MKFLHLFYKLNDDKIISISIEIKKLDLLINGKCDMDSCSHMFLAFDPYRATMCINNGLTDVKT